MAEVRSRSVILAALAALALADGFAGEVAQLRF